MKAEEIYGKAKELVPVLPKDDITKIIIKQAVDQLNSASTTVESLRTLMNEIAAKLPEYSIVMAMKGVGTSLGPQLMAEIGDVSRFTHKGAITAFAGVDPGVNESGTYVQKSVSTSKRGSSSLRKTLFQVMDFLIKTRSRQALLCLYDRRCQQVSKDLLRTSKGISCISSGILIIHLFITTFRLALVWWPYFDAQFSTRINYSIFNVL